MHEFIDSKEKVVESLYDILEKMDKRISDNDEKIHGLEGIWSKNKEMAKKIGELMRKIEGKDCSLETINMKINEGISCIFQFFKEFFLRKTGFFKKII